MLNICLYTVIIIIIQETNENEIKSRKKTVSNLKLNQEILNFYRMIYVNSFPFSKKI